MRSHSIHKQIEITLPNDGIASESILGSRRIDDLRPGIFSTHLSVCSDNSRYKITTTLKNKFSFPLGLRLKLSSLMRGDQQIQRSSMKL